MATEIDKRVVEMQFDNKNFEKNCKESLTTLEKLKMALNFDGAKGLEDMTKAANKVDLSNISKSADAVSVRFSAMQIAGVTAIQEITRHLLYFGKNVWDSTFGQIRSGGMARTLKIEQANFQMQALAENMEQVKKGLVEATAVVKAMGQAASDAVDGTAYGLDAASAVASQLMASGLLDPTRMKDYLRAIAGAASMTGRSYEDIGNIFTTVASNGRLMTMQLRQFSAAGLNLSATLAKSLNKTEAEINDMVTKGKISFEDFAKALGDAFGDAAGKADDTFSGVTTNIKAQLSRIGQLFTDPFVENVIPFLKQVKARIKDVRTVLVPVAKTWTKFFEYISKNAEVFMKNLNVARLRPFVNGIENILVALIEIIWTIGRAVKEVFPKQVQDQINDGVRGFERLTRSLIPSKKALDNFKQVVKAVLIPLKAIWTVGVAVAKYAIYPLVKLFITFASTLMQIGEIFKPIINSLLDFVTNGEFLTNIVQIIASGLVTLMNVLTIILECVMTLMSELTKSGTFQLILDFITTVASLLMDVITVALLFIFGILNDILSLFTSERITAFLQVVVDLLDLAVVGILTLFQAVGNIFEEISKGEGVLADVVNFLKEIAFLIKDIFAGEDISDNLDRLGELLDKLVGHVKNAWNALGKFLKDINAGKIIIYAFAIAIVLLILSVRRLFNALAGIGEVIRKGIDNVVGALSDIRQVIKGLIKVSPAVQLILAIAVAIGVLTVSLKVLGEMKWQDLLEGGLALAIFAGGLLALGVVLSKIDLKGTKEGLALIPVILGMAVAVLAITSAVVLLGKADLTLRQLATALLTVVVLMAGVTGALILINKTAQMMFPEEQKLMVTAGTILGFAAAIWLLSKACLSIAESEATFKQAMTGLAAVAGLIVTLAGSMALLSLTGMTFGGGVGAMAFVLSFILVLKAIEKLSRLPFEQIVNGLKSAFGVILALSSLYLAFVGISLLAGGNVFVENMTRMLAALGSVIALSVAAVMILGGMDTQQAARGIATILLLSLIFTLITRILLKSFDKFSTNMKVYKDVNILKSFSSFLIAFSACLIILAIASRIASGVSFGGWAVVASIMVILAACLQAVEEASAHTKRANIGVMISYIGGIVAILAVMTILTFADYDKLSLAIFAVIGVMLALALLGSRFATTSDEVSKSDKKGKGVGYFVAFIAGLIGVIAVTSDLVKNTKDLGSTSIAVSTAIILGVMFMFISILATLAYVSEKIKDSEKFSTIAKDLAIVTGCIVAIAAAITVMALLLNTPTAQAFTFLAFVELFGGLAWMLLSFKLFLKDIEDLDAEEVDKVANTIKKLSSVLVVIMGSITAMSLLLNTPTAQAFSVLAFIEIFGGLALMLLTFKMFLKTIEDLNAEEVDKVAKTIIRLSTVLAVITGVITTMALLLNTPTAQAFSILAFIEIFGGLALMLLTFKMFLKSIKDLSSEEVDKVVKIIFKLSTVLAVIAGVITVMSLLLSTPTAQAFSVLAFVEIFGGLALMLLTFKMFLKSMKDVDSNKIQTIALVIGGLCESLIIIAIAVGGLAYIINKGGSKGWIGALASFGILIASFASVCGALYILQKKVSNVKNLLAIAGSIVAASSAFIVIAGAIYMLKDIPVDDGYRQKILSLIGPFLALSALLVAVNVFSEEIDPIDMLATAAAIVAGSISMLVIAESIKKLADASSGIDVTKFKELEHVLLGIIILLGSLIAVGGILGGIGSGGAMVLAGIAAIMVAFTIFSAGVYVLANAVDVFTDAILKLNNVKIDYHVIVNNLRNGIQGACQAIIDSAPDMIQALGSLFQVILAAVASVVGTVVAVGAAFLLAFMEGMLAALPEALAILSAIMKIIVDWLKEPGQMELIGDFFRLIGEMLVEVVKGALEGLLGWLGDAVINLNDKIGEAIFETTETYKHIDDQNHKREVENMQKMQADNIIKYYSDKASFQNVDGLLLKTYDDAVWESMIEDFNRVAEAARSSGEELSQSVIELANNQLMAAPEKMLAKLDSAYGRATDTVMEFTGEVEVANETIASEMHTEQIDNITRSADDASKAINDIGTSTEKMNDKLQNESTESSITLDNLKNKASALGEGFINSLKNIDIKKTANKLGIDHKKLGSMLGKITGVSFGEDYEETLDYYMEDAMKKIYDKSGQWQYKWQTFKNDQGERIYRSAEEYANAQMDAAGDNTSYALKKLADFFGINLDVNDALKDGTDALGDFGSQMADLEKSTDKTKTKLEEFRDGIKESIASAMHGIFDEVKEQEYIDPEEMLYRMSENVRQVGEWARNIATLAARGMSEGLLNELKDMGPQGAAKVQAFVDMTDEQLQAANRRWKAAEFMPDYGTKEIENAYKKAGFNASLGFKEGVDATMASDAMSEFADAGLNTLENKYEINSPSKRTARDGEYAAMGFAVGLNSPMAQTMLRGATLKIANLVLETLNREMRPQKFQEAANNVFDGFANGMANRIPQILSKVTLFCSQLIATFQRVLRMHSPSKAMEDLGYNAMAGFGNGMEEGSEEVMDVTDQSANDILDQMKANIAAVANGWSEDNVYQPVIRPVFDMDAINQGYSDIQSWFANSQGINLNGSISRLTPTTRDEDASTQQVIDAINRINNDDVVREIGALRDDISQLQSAITSMQVVLNTGTLVGQLVEPIDRALGSKALYNSRGRY